MENHENSPTDQNIVRGGRMIEEEHYNFMICSLSLINSIGLQYNCSVGISYAEAVEKVYQLVRRGS